MGPAASRVEVRRRLRAPVDRVFAAFADSALVAQWLMPSPEIKLHVLQFDFRVGGSYRFAYDVAAGHKVFIGGTYISIEPPTSIVFSWVIEPPDEHAGIHSEVTVSLQPSGSATELVIWHDKWDRADAESRHAEGWSGALDQLAAQLEGAAQ